MAGKKEVGKVLILLGILGIVFVCSWDIILRKPVNDITGPRSIAGLAISVIVIILGIISFKKQK